MRFGGQRTWRRGGVKREIHLAPLERHSETIERERRIVDTARCIAVEHIQDAGGSVRSRQDVINVRLPMYLTVSTVTSPANLIALPKADELAVPALTLVSQQEKPKTSWSIRRLLR